MLSRIIPAPVDSRPLATLRKPPGREFDVRPWRVLHLCEGVRQITPVLEVQLAAGMQPATLTPRGVAGPVAWLSESSKEGAQGISLLNAWREVRTWRRLISENGGGAEILHAHSFPAGMAAVRAGAPLVYDVHGFVEEQTASAGQTAAHSWLARSFRTAEQFVLSRAGAVVVHSSADYRGALERGTPSANLFFVPSLSPASDAELEPLRIRTLTEKYDAVYSYVLGQRKSGRGPMLPPGWQPLAACW